MLTVYSTATIKEADRFDYWHQMTCRHHSLTECERLSEGLLDARYANRPFSKLQLNSFRSSSRNHMHMRYKRGPHEIRKNPVDDLVFFFVSRGQIGIAQDGREASLGPGDMMMYHQATPFTLDTPKGISSAILVSIPSAHLAVRVPNAIKLTARRMRSESSRLAGKFFQQLMSMDIGSDTAAARRLGTAAIDILTTTLETELEGNSSTADHQLDKIKRFILSNLHDPELDAERIAKANNVAPRTLNRMFVADGSTPIRWLWQQRLVASYAALAEGKVKQVTEAAMNYGFNDLSHFSRAFKNTFGCSPQSLKSK